MWRVLAVAIAAGLLAWAPAPAGAAELVMFESEGCPWCALWHRQIGPIYPKTKEATLLPLRRVDIGAMRPAESGQIGPVRYTPTFVAVANGREVGRIVGYPGEDHFWAALEQLHAQAAAVEAGAGQTDAAQ